MSDKLDSVISAYVAPDKKVSLESALSKVEDLHALAAEAHERSKELAAKEPDDVTDEDIEALKNYTDVSLAVTSILESRKKSADKADRFNKLKEVVGSVSLPEVKAESEAGGEEPAVEPGVERDVVAVDASQEQVQVPSEVPELVGAGATAFRSVTSLPSAPPVKGKSLAGTRLTSTFAADGGGRVTERKYDSMLEIAKTVTAQFQSYPMGGGNSKTTLAVFKREELDEFTVLNRHGDTEVIDRVANMTPTWDRTKGQFAAGWCAPSENIYELCPYVTSLDGLWDVPELLAARGGVNTTSGPNFATLYANASIGQVLTEAQVIAATPKTCIEVDCPSFVETRLDVNPLCVTGNLLTQAGYPEYVERFIRESIAANIHKINLNILLRAVTASTAVTLPGATGPVDTSSASWFLDAASLYATWLRDRYRLSQDALIEVVAPYWYMQQQTADLARRNGVDLLTSEQRLNAAFAERNIRVQWVYDWQPMSATAAGAAARPTTVQILVYIPGTFVKLTSPVINLGTVHSAAQLALNQYTALFVEEGFNLLERCFESLVITVPTCPSGTTGAATGSCDSTP